MTSPSVGCSAVFQDVLRVFRECSGVLPVCSRRGRPSQLRFSLPSIIITITSNQPWNTETHKTDRNPPITNHKPWPFEPVKVKFCFLRGPLRWLAAAKNAIVIWLLNFRIRIFVKSAVTRLRFKYVSQTCHFETNQGKRHEINKSSRKFLHVYY